MFSHAPEAEFSLAISGLIREGHGVASGRADSCPYPEGTLALQIPLFRERGVDLDAFFRGTLNVDIAPLRFQLVDPDVTLQNVAWTGRIPPEHFSFCACWLEVHGSSHQALVYHPHPETNAEHFQNASLIEVLARFVGDVMPGLDVTLRMRPRQVRWMAPADPCA